MLLKDVKVGEEYVAVSWFDSRKHSEPPAHYEPGNFTRFWEELTDWGFRVRVTETRVDVPSYQRPGVRAVRVDPAGNVREDCDPEAMRAVQLIMPWAEYVDRSNAHEEEIAIAAEEQRLRREREAREEKERRAVQWMEREFEHAKMMLGVVGAVLSEHGYDPGHPPDDATMIRAIVERRNPEGNPYLKEA